MTIVHYQHRRTEESQEPPPKVDGMSGHREWSILGIRPTPTVYAVLLAFLMTLVNVFWAVRNHTSPSWDQSHYLTLTWMYQQALDHHGPVALIRTIYTATPGRAPLFMVAMLPFSYLFHDGPGMGLALNVMLWPVLLLSAGAIAKEFFNDRARLVTVLVLAPMPGIVSLAHTQLQDFMLMTMATLGVWLVVRTRNLQSRKASLGLGIVIALGTLTKLSFPIALSGPLLVVGIACVSTSILSRDHRGLWRTLRKPLTNVALIGIVAVVPTLLWYIPNWAATLAYLRTTFKIQPGTVAHPLALHNLAVFALGMVNGGTGSLIFCLGVLLLLLSAPRLIVWYRNRVGFWSTLARAAFLGSWIVIPVVAVAVSSNQTERYAVAAVPAVAVVIGGLTSEVSWKAIRWAAVTVVVLIVVNATLFINFSGYHLPFVPAIVTFQTAAGAVYFQFGSPIGSTGSTGPPLSQDYTLNVIKYIEAHSRGNGGKIEPRSIAILELQGYLNNNNLPYYADIRNDPFTFATISAAPSVKDLEDQLKDYNFALYIPQPSAKTEVAYGRIGELNATAAARQMTPAIFSLFKSRPARIFAGAGQAQGDYVLVLERR